VHPGSDFANTGWKCNPSRWAYHIICSEKNHVDLVSFWKDCTLHGQNCWPNEWRENFTSTLCGGVEWWADTACVGIKWPNCNLGIIRPHLIILEELAVSWNWQTSKRKTVDQKV
jgi:hypothetical protein